MTLDSLVLKRKDGEDYTLRFEPGFVGVEYLGTEISEYLRRGFVPQGGENLPGLEERIQEAQNKREELLDSEGYEVLTQDVTEEFDSKFDTSIADFVMVNYVKDGPLLLGMARAGTMMG